MRPDTRTAWIDERSRPCADDWFERCGYDARTARRRGAGLGHEAALEGLSHAAFDVVVRETHHFRDLGDDQEARAIEHALLTEREALRLRQEREALQHVRDVVDVAG